jgi:hypothetical protein
VSQSPIGSRRDRAPALRPPVSTVGRDESLQRGVLEGVVGVVVVPEPPDDLAPGAAEDAGGVVVAGAAGARLVVDVGGPGVVPAACVSEGAERAAESVVAGPSKLRVAAFA